MKKTTQATFELPSALLSFYDTYAAMTGKTRKQVVGEVLTDFALGGMELLVDEFNRTSDELLKMKAWPEYGKSVVERA